MCSNAYYCIKNWVVIAGDLLSAPVWLLTSEEALLPKIELVSLSENIVGIHCVISLLM